MNASFAPVARRRVRLSGVGASAENAKLKPGTAFLASTSVMWGLHDGSTQHGDRSVIVH